MSVNINIRVNIAQERCAILKLRKCLRILNCPRIIDGFNNAQRNFEALKCKDICFGAITRRLDYSKWDHIEVSTHTDSIPYSNL